MKINFEKSKSPVERELAKLAVDVVLEMNLDTSNLIINFQRYAIRYGVLGLAQTWLTTDNERHYKIFLRVDSAAASVYDRKETLIHELIHVADYQDEDIRTARKSMNKFDWDLVIHQRMETRVGYWMNKLSN